jgi:hypothetical protein
MDEAGRRAGLVQIAGHPPLAFLRNYVARGGIRDGAPGLIISALNSYYVFLKFAKLWELQRTSDQRPASSNQQPATSNQPPAPSCEPAAPSDVLPSR